MGMIEDVRNALQDLVTPDLKEIKTRLDNLEKRLDEKFAEFEKRLDLRLGSIESGINNLLRFASLEERLNRLETQAKQQTSIERPPA